MTQDDVASHLKVSRATVAQMELGNRGITGLELDRLAYLYGRDIRELLADEMDEDDGLVAMFRAHPDIAEQECLVDALRACIALGRELTNLERMLEADRDGQTVAAYPLPTPRTKWDAISQGQTVAEQERRRLGLGDAPLPNVAELLESQGIRTAQVVLPEDVSGITVIDQAIGLFVGVNRAHHVLRRRFSYAHEYCHALLDREHRGAISRSRERDTLLEVRANTFAAAFLMPERGVRRFVRNLGKGRSSRQNADVFDEGEVVRAGRRAAPGSQEIQLYDVVLVAHHFGVSVLAALYRMRNLRLINQEQLEALKEKDQLGASSEVQEGLGLPKPDHNGARNEFRHRFLALGVEAVRREEITASKLFEIAAMVEVPAQTVEKLLRDAGLDDEEDGAVGIALPDD